MFIAELTASDLRERDPFMAALAAYFNDLGARAGAASRRVQGYLAGGLAVRCYTGSRTTGDIDMFFRGGRVLVPPNTSIQVHWKGRDYSLLFDHQYTPDFGLLHPDYVSRAVGMLSARETSLPISVLHPIDLAITKVARFQDHDRADIRDLAKLDAFDTEAFTHLAEEALAYAIGDPAFIRLNMRDAAELVSGARAPGDE